MDQGASQAGDGGSPPSWTNLDLKWVIVIWMHAVVHVPKKCGAKKTIHLAAPRVLQRAGDRITSEQNLTVEFIGLGLVGGEISNKYKTSAVMNFGTIEYLCRRKKIRNR